MERLVTVLSICQVWNITNHSQQERAIEHKLLFFAVGDWWICLCHNRPHFISEVSNYI